MATGEPRRSSEDDGGLFADINITPLTDIFLVLLIIFMVTTTAITAADSGASGFKVNLPKAGASALAPGSELKVAILSDGRTVVDGSVVDLDALKKRLSDAAAADQGTLLMIQADESVPHGRVVDVMDLAKRAGLVRLAIATRAER